MALVAYTAKELDQMARLMRAEAVGEGELGMLMVGNVIMNRVIANCLTFKNTNTINSVVYQSPGGFAGVNSSLFYSSATTLEKELALRNIDGETYFPATHALWFYSPAKNTSCVSLWYDQELSGKYKSHCFYKPYIGVCTNLY
ncbi:MAG: cell wall hydrolase [bacterium]|nr:cell wall hydrolase [bacterium]